MRYDQDAHVFFQLGSGILQWWEKGKGEGSYGILEAGHKISLLQSAAIRHQVLQNSYQNSSIIQGKGMHQPAERSLVCVFGGILT